MLIGDIQLNLPSNSLFDSSDEFIFTANTKPDYKNKTSSDRNNIFFCILGIAVKKSH